MGKKQKAISERLFDRAIAGVERFKSEGFNRDDVDFIRQMLKDACDAREAEFHLEVHLPSMYDL